MAYQWPTTAHNVDLNGAMPVTTWLREPIVYDFFTLLQVGERRLCRAPLEMGGKSCWEIGYVTNGSGTLSTADGAFPVSQGDCLVQRPNEAFMISPGGGMELGIRFIRIELHGLERGDHPFACMEATLRDRKISVRKDSRGVGDLFRRLLDEVRCDSKHKLLMAGSCVNQILVAVYRNYLEKNEPHILPKQQVPASIGSDSRRDIARRAASYIGEKIMELKELTEVADAMGYSYSYLSHVFRDEMGTSLQAYHSHSKISTAMELLRDGENSVTRVAELLQYQSIHSFSKAFKKLTGFSPSKYQLQQAR